MYAKQTSRLGKLIVILLGSIGLLYVGGGHAHADAVGISSKTGSTLSSTATTSTNQASASVSLTSGGDNNNDQNNQTTPAGNDNSSGDIAATATDTHQITAAPNSEIDGANSLAAQTTNESVDSTNPSTPASTPGPTTPSAPSSTATSVSESSTTPTYYYHTQHLATAAATNQNTPQAPAAVPAPKPAPAMPTGTLALVSTVATPSPLLEFQSTLAGLATLGNGGMAVPLALLVTLIMLALGSSFVEYLRAMGSTRAPRGATSHFHFAFPIDEFALSSWLNTDSFFSVLKLPLGSGLYVGGRG